MSDLNGFIIELLARLNEEASKKNINADIDALEKVIKKIKLQAEIDPKSVNSGQQTGKKIGDSINQGLSKSLKDVKQTISNTINEFSSSKLKSVDLSKLFNLNRKDIDSSVISQVRSLTKEINSLSSEVLKTNSNSSWENIIGKVQSLYKMLNQFGQVRDLSSFKESLDILDRFQGKKIFAGNKPEVLANTGMSVRELNNQFKSLGVTFTTVSDKAIKLDAIWDELLNISPGLEKFTAFGDQINAIVDHLKIVKEAKFGTKNLLPAADTGEASKILTDYLSNLENASKKLSILRAEQAEIEQIIANGSTTSADKVVQNEQRKQEAYQQTANVQKQIAKDESLIKSGANILTFENTNNAAREALGYFKELLKDETELIAVSERFNQANKLSSFAISVKRASAEVETLKYALKNTGSEENPLYALANIGAELNNKGAVKQIQQMEKVLTDYQAKLDSFKTKYSKTSLDYSGFETVFNNFKNGIGTVNVLKSAFNQLENSAKMGVQSLKSQKASLDPIQQALNNMRDMPSMLKNLETNMESLQDKTAVAGISISDLSAQYVKLKNEMDVAGGKVPLDSTWVKEYQQLMSSVVSATKRVAAEQAKAEKSTNSFFASFKNGFSFLKYYMSASFLTMQAIGKIKQAFTELKSVNSIMTEISKVTEMTTAQLKRLGSEAYEAASKYGRTISDYLTGVQEMSRAGFQGDQAKEMAELSVLAQAAGDISAELSNEYLIATNAAYKLNGEVSKLNDVLDGQNYVANRNAVSMEHLANATKIVASQAASSGVAVNEMTAAVGTMVATTQQSGDVAGRAFKAILMNIQQVSGELDDGEVIDEESLTKYEKACNDLGVSLKTVKDGIVSLRDPMEILKELAEAYTSLDKMDARRANLISAIGGKQRGNQLNALLENWSTYEKMLVDYSQGTGSAMNEAMKSANNWEGSLNRLHNTWVNTVENIANSDAIITIINGTNSLLDVLNKLTSKLGSVGSIGVGAFALFGKGRSNDFAL